MVSSMQAAISSQLAEIAGTVSNLEERITAVEETVAASSASGVQGQVTADEMTTPTRPTDSRRERKRRTPLQIQVYT